MCNQEIVDEAKTLWDKLMGPKARAPKGAPKVWPKCQFASRETDAPAGCTLVLPTFRCHDCVLADSVDKRRRTDPKGGGKGNKGKKGDSFVFTGNCNLCGQYGHKAANCPGDL